MFRSMSKSIPKSNPHLLVRRIFVRWGNDLDNLLPNQIKLRDDIIDCGTGAKGSDLILLPGQKPQVVNFRCKNRLCPHCRFVGKDKRVRSTMKRFLTLHSHSLVTVIPPQELNSIICENQDGNDYEKHYEKQNVLYNALFTTPVKAIKKYADDKKNFGGLVGIVSVLQTWKDNLDFYLHFHFVITNYAIRDGQLVEPETLDWIDTDKILDRIKKLALKHVKKNQHLWKDQPETYQSIVKCLQEGQWEVHCEPTGNEVKKVKDENGNIRYVADHQKNLKKVLKYSKHSPLTGKRIVIEGDYVTLHYKTHSGQKRQETMHCVKFARRYMQHVLPPNFRQVRYSSLAHSAHKETLQQIKKQLRLESAGGKIENEIEQLQDCKQELTNDGQVLTNDKQTLNNYEPVLIDCANDDKITSGLFFALCSCQDCKLEWNGNKTTSDFSCYENYLLTHNPMMFFEILVPYFDARANG